MSRRAAPAPPLYAFQRGGPVLYPVAFERKFQSGSSGSLLLAITNARAELVATLKAPAEPARATEAAMKYLAFLRGLLDGPESVQWAVGFRYHPMFGLDREIETHDLRVEGAYVLLALAVYLGNSATVLLNESPFHPTSGFPSEPKGSTPADGTPAARLRIGFHSLQQAAGLLDACAMAVTTINSRATDLKELPLDFDTRVLSALRNLYLVQAQEVSYGRALAGGYSPSLLAQLCEWARGTAHDAFMTLQTLDFPAISWGRVGRLRFYLQCKEKQFEVRAYRWQGKHLTKENTPAALTFSAIASRRAPALKERWSVFTERKGESSCGAVAHLSWSVKPTNYNRWCALETTETKAEMDAVVRINTLVYRAQPAEEDGLPMPSGRSVAKPEAFAVPAADAAFSDPSITQGLRASQPRPPAADSSPAAPAMDAAVAMEGGEAPSAFKGKEAEVVGDKEEGLPSGGNLPPKPAAAASGKSEAAGTQKKVGGGNANAMMDNGGSCSVM